MTLLFESNRDDPRKPSKASYQIYRLEIDADRQRTTLKITNADEVCTSPHGGPDNSVLFTARSRVGGYLEMDICSVDQEGQNWRRLATEPDDYNCFEYPICSPDYTQIVFSSMNQGIQIMQIDGTKRRKLIGKEDLKEGYNRILATAWSPDGREILLTGHFDEDRDFDSEILILTLADSSIRTLETGLKQPWSPVPSPAGEWIVFSGCEDDDNHDIYKIRADGSGLQQLTTSHFGEVRPSWSPDGSHIVFTRGFDYGNSELFVIDSDGSNPMQITDSPGESRSAFWVRTQPATE
jgi:TolB protein